MFGLRWLAPWETALKNVEFYEQQQGRVEELIKEVRVYEGWPKDLPSPSIGLAMNLVIAEKLGKLEPMRRIQRIKEETEKWIGKTIRGILPYQIEKYRDDPFMPYDQDFTTAEEEEIFRPYQEEMFKRLAYDPIGSVLALWEKPLRGTGAITRPSAKEAWLLYRDPDRLYSPHILQGPTTEIPAIDIVGSTASPWLKFEDEWININEENNVRIGPYEFGKFHPWSKVASRAMARIKWKRENPWKGALYEAGAEEILDYLTIPNQLSRLMWPRSHYWRQGVPVVAMSDWLAKKKHTEASSDLQKERGFLTVAG